jgi:hypothetical protein
MNKWIVVLVTIATSSLVIASTVSEINSQSATTDVLDSTTILLDLKKIPANDYILLYSTAPKVITSGSVVAKLPCNDDSEPTNWTLIGGIGLDLSMMKVELIQGNPGNMCAFRAEIPNESAPDISGIILVNTTSDPIRMPATSSVVITVQGVSAP